MKNPFENHGIGHLSVSQLNLWSAAPGVYVMERLLKKRAPVGAAAHRGSAVEAGVEAALNGEVLDKAIETAERIFREKTPLSTDPRKAKEADAIPGMVERGAELLKPWGKPDRSQVKKVWQMEGVAVPMLGFSDFEFDEHGLIVDLKTSHALPSKIKNPHARQVSSYMGGDSNMRGGVAYVTGKKSHMLEVENPREHVKALTAIAISLQNFLSISADPHELAALLSVDPDSFYLADPQARQNAFEVFKV